MRTQETPQMLRHRHHCDHTGTSHAGSRPAVWEHGENCGNEVDDQGQTFLAAHGCPLCGTLQTTKYQGEVRVSHLGVCHHPQPARPVVELVGLRPFMTEEHLIR